MSVVCILDDLKNWAQENLCSKIKLKVPPDDDGEPTEGRKPTGTGYEYQLVTPTAFTLFVPSKDKLPPNVISPIPSVCVRFIKGEEKLTERSGNIGVQLCFSTWDTGYHKQDILNPNDQTAGFQRNYEGWRDAWNFVDIALREVGNSTTVGGYEIDRTVPVEYGPFTEQGAIVESYPFWFAWVSFSIKYPLQRNVTEIENFL